jgi:hypothetical protein
MAQVVECLPSKCKALSSNTSTRGIKQKKKIRSIIGRVGINTDRKITTDSYVTLGVLLTLS